MLVVELGAGGVAASEEFHVRSRRSKRTQSGGELTLLVPPTRERSCTVAQVFGCKMSAAECREMETDLNRVMWSNHKSFVRCGIKHAKEGFITCFILFTAPADVDAIRRTELLYIRNKMADMPNILQRDLLKSGDLCALTEYRVV